MSYKQQSIGHGTKLSQYIASFKDSELKRWGKEMMEKDRWTTGEPKTEHDTQRQRQRQSWREFEQPLSGSQVLP